MSTILVVDDDPDMRALLRHKLMAAGYDVIVADDGDVALRTVKSRGADLILADINMPRMTGDEFVRSLRDDPSLPAIPVVYLSGLAPDHALARKTLGFPLLSKPLDVKELLAMLRRQLGTRAPTERPSPH